MDTKLGTSSDTDTDTEYERISCNLGFGFKTQDPRFAVRAQRSQVYGDGDEYDHDQDKCTTSLRRINSKDLWTLRR
jgi:hypothetical protein